MTGVQWGIDRAKEWITGDPREKWKPPSETAIFAERYISARAGREALGDFCEWLVEEGVTPKTASNYVQQVWASLMATGGDPMKDFANPKFARATKLTLKAAWGRLAEWLEDTELERVLSSKHTARVIADKRNTKASKAKPGFGVEIVDRFLAEIDKDHDDPDYPWIWPVLRMTLILGLRAGVDTTWITRESVERAIEHGILTIVSKGDKLRSLPAAPVRPELLRLLELPGWMAIADLIAPRSTRGSDLQHQTAYAYMATALKNYAERVGVDPAEVRTHRFRRAAALRVYAETKDIVLVQQMLGHGRITTTQRYLEDDRTAEIGEAIERAYAQKG